MTGSLSHQAYLAKARRALGGARALLLTEDVEGGCSRAYYAMFDAAHAALIAVGVEIPKGRIKTHAGLIALFGQHLVQTGRVDAAQGAALSQVFRLRQLGDYSEAGVEIADTEWAIERAAEFLVVIAKLCEAN